MEYKGYVIEQFQSSWERWRGVRRWRARVRRIDGQKIKIAVTGNEVETLTTGGMESFSADDAVRLAKDMIDGGGMQ